MNSTVVNQWVSNTTKVSGLRSSRTSRRSRSSPVTRLISRPSFSASRTAFGSMIVGTCDRKPAPAMSPTSPLLSACLRPGAAPLPPALAHGERASVDRSFVSELS